MGKPSRVVESHYVIEFSVTRVDRILMVDTYNDMVSSSARDTTELAKCVVKGVDMASTITKAKAHLDLVDNNSEVGGND
jgi:hypothetical protein